MTVDADTRDRLYRGLECATFGPFDADDLIPRGYLPLSDADVEFLVGIGALVVRGRRYGVTRLGWDGMYRWMAERGDVAPLVIPDDF